MTAIDRHQLAAISIVGSFLDVLGALYLAYDVLGGKHGPLRLLTRMVTYSVLFGVGFGLPLGFAFGVATGLTNGITIAIEMTRAAKMDGRFPFRIEILMSAIRGLGYGIGASYMHGWRFGTVFGALCALGQIGGYMRGLWPGMSYRQHLKLSISSRELAAVLVRTVGYAAAGFISAIAAGHQMHAVMFGMDVGLAVGIITAITHFITPAMEWVSENMPDRRLGVFGIILILIGFGLQSVQYWITLFDIQVM